MRLLCHTDASTTPGLELSDDDLAHLYAWPNGGGVRANFVSTIDGSAVGADGLSGSINTAADGRVFALQRRLADCVLVGARTARAEGYQPGDTPLVIVSNRGVLPPTLDVDSRRVILATCAASKRSASEHVWIHGAESVDLSALVARLAAAGMPRILTEGGPSLFGSLLAEGLVSEIALTWSPLMVGDTGVRIVKSALPQALSLTLRHLLEEDNTLLALWQSRSS